MRGVVFFMNQIFIGFQTDGQVYGSTYRVTEREKAEDVHSKIQSIFKENTPEQIQEIFKAIEWQAFDPKENVPTGELLLSLLQKGVEEFEKTLYKIFSFLLGNKELLEVNEKGKQELVQSNASQYVKKENGQTKILLLDSYEAFNQENSGNSYLFDLNNETLLVYKDGKPFETLVRLTV